LKKEIDMSKISVIGAGNVGASCAEYIGMKNMAAEVVLLDLYYVWLVSFFKEIIG